MARRTSKKPLAATSLIDALGLKATALAELKEKITTITQALAESQCRCGLFELELAALNTKVDELVKTQQTKQTIDERRLRFSRANAGMA